MMQLADLPPEVQMDLRDKRALIPGWEPFTHATPEQWMTYYQILNAPAREYLVASLLELAQQGSQCFEANHDEMNGTFWQQLRGVVELHNARVTEVQQLLDELARLRAHIEGTPDLLERVAAAEREANPMIEVQFTDNPQPGQRFYVTKPAPVSESRST